MPHELSPATLRSSLGPLHIDLTEGEVVELLSVWKFLVHDLSSAFDGGPLQEAAGDGASALNSTHDGQRTASGRTIEATDSADEDDNSGELDDDDDWGCSCAVDGVPCSIASGCDCIATYGHFYLPSSNAGPALILPHPTHLPLVECGHVCACAAQGCANRPTQGPINSYLALRRSPISSLGLFATAPLPRGTFICTYAGESISTTEARARWAGQQTRGEGNYVFCLREGERRVNVDPTSIGGVGRFLNHSHAPNLVPLPVHHVPTHLTTARIAFYALRDISPGEELVWDYGDGQNGGERAGDTACRVPCACGGENCDGFLPYDAGL